MDPRLLSLFEKELRYLKEQGKEFAKIYPKAATNLGITDTSIQDPFVERLLEGFAFLAARIHLKIDAEFPKFSSRLLDAIYPGFLAPTPSFCIVQFGNDEGFGTGGGSYNLPRGTRLKVLIDKNKKTACEFKTTKNLLLSSIRLNQVTTDVASSSSNVRPGQNYNSDTLSQLDFKFSRIVSTQDKNKWPDNIELYIDGSPSETGFIYELISERVVAIQARDAASKEWVDIAVENLVIEGFSLEQAALPDVKNVFSGYRILREYFAFPEKYNFFSITGLHDLPVREGSTLDLRLILDCEFQSDIARINKDNFKLFCSPAVNLIDKKSVRLPITKSSYEHHAVSDIIDPLDYEVYSINKIEGYTKDNVADTVFWPLNNSSFTARSSSFFSTRREQRLVSDRMLKEGHRTAYVGSEVFFSLVDKNDLPVNIDIKQVSIEMTVTNRDLPILIQGQVQKSIIPVESLPVSDVRMIAGPSTPRALPQDGSIVWLLIKHLGFNYNDMIRGDRDSGRESIKEILTVYSLLGNPSVALNIESIVDLKTKIKNMRIPGNGPIILGRGIEVELTLDESKIHYGGAYLFSSILRFFLLRHISINSFMLMTVFSVQRGQIATFQPVLGLRPGI